MAEMPVLDVSVRLYYNPWQGLIDNDGVVKFLAAGGSAGISKIHELMQAKKVDPEKCDGSFTCAILDPTRTGHREPVAIRPPMDGRLLGLVLIGPNAEGLIPNALDKADGRDRHGRNHGKLVHKASFCLAASDFAYGYSTSYKGVPSGGSGLSEKQDRTVAKQIEKSSLRAIGAWIDLRIAEARQNGGKRRWYNPADEPGSFYLIDTEPIAVSSSV